ncbi:BsuPI-related putative proteinase inhibitor [Mesobacillus maritimus]|uniref:BsuPI-related putative proteinase inhibitor n=1 Tax=Mesobacillus maritimus TaxID=1643336 RepID=UPI00203E81C3|nr:BsuPI-related putative proteinase inhibitor [Mesobacillus maritimus]MCM3668255.1 BsuPI-related putative proteinase inhibitor [Mesobacillus maritimus]
MKLLTSFMLIGMLLVGCGTAEQPVSEEPAVETGGNGIVAGEMEATLVEKSPLVFEYKVKNQTEQEVKLDFTSSQRFDYSVETKDGKEVFLFSSMTSFLQVLGTEHVKQGDVLSYELQLKDLNLEPGTYVLTSWMTPKDGPQYEATIEFTIE